MKPPRVAPGTRVLFVHQSTDLYGSDRVLLEIADAFLRAGGAPIVVAPGDGPLLHALRARGIEVHAVDALDVLKLSRGMATPRGLLRLALAVPRALAALDRVVAGRPVQWVHSNTLAVLGGALWARRRGVEHLWHVHEMVERPRAVAASLPWLVQRFADRVVCNSRATSHWLLRAQPTLAGRTRVIWNGVADAHLNRDALAAPAALAAHFRAGTPHAIGLVGRISRTKGHALLLDAAEKLHRAGRRDFGIVFIGSAPPGQEHFTDALRARIAASPMADRVQLHGFMPDVSAAYAALDIVCVPSTGAEAFGLVAVEAMAAARPVVAASIGGLPEVVLHGRTGLLHAPGDADQLAAHLAALLDNRAHRDALGRAGRTRFESHFGVRAMTLRFLEIFSLPQPAGGPS